MGNIYRLQQGGYEIICEGDGSKAEVTGFEGVGSRMYIPDFADSEKTVPITSVGRKAVLANKGLREVSLPGSVESLGDWAFAQCENMENFIIRAAVENTESSIANIVFGKGVFDNCHKIKNICVGYEEPDALSYLLGTIIYKMPAEYLLKDNSIGSSEWFAMWDQCLSTFLNEPDIDGYTDMVLCGEEDIFYQEPDFAMNKRKKKAALCMLRLMHDASLSDDMRNKYTDYVLSHVKGAPSEEAWEVLLEEYGDEVDYFRLLADIGGITSDNIDGMLLDMGQYHAEAKAYLLHYKQENMSSGGGSVFDEFEL